VAPSLDNAQAVIGNVHRIMAERGRAPGDIRFFQGLSFVIGSTEDEVARRDRELDETIDEETMVAHLGGIMGIEIEGVEMDAPIGELETEGSKSLLDWVRAAVTDREPVVRDIGMLTGRASRISGTPEQIADKLAAWQAIGVDGINLVNSTIPGSYSEFIEHVMPVLQARGLARTEYAPGTLRQKIFGRDKLPDTHPAAAWRGAFKSGAVAK
jgi:alkanesulfonate monooxygenase SsuD/methylene tetrahydromethanopterin reductase-like flavin-dependent oxidoreductase (luciferase family)